MLSKRSRSCRSWYQFRAGVARVAGVVLSAGYGLGKTGADCLNHGLEDCAISGCFVGFHYDYDSGLCKPNICSCQNGDPKIGADCLIHEKVDCIPSSCHAGFHYTSKSDSNICEPNVCNCQSPRKLASTV